MHDQVQAFNPSRTEFQYVLTFLVTETPWDTAFKCHDSGQGRLRVWEGRIMTSGSGGGAPQSLWLERPLEGRFKASSCLAVAILIKGTVK